MRASAVRPERRQPEVGRDEEIAAQEIGADHLVGLARRDDAGEARGDLAPESNNARLAATHRLARRCSRWSREIGKSFRGRKLFREPFGEPRVKIATGLFLPPRAGTLVARLGFIPAALLYLLARGTAAGPSPAPGRRRGGSPLPRLERSLTASALDCRRPAPRARCRWCRASRRWSRPSCRCSWCRRGGRRGRTWARSAGPASSSAT
jgi:hypothetical protein